MEQVKISNRKTGKIIHVGVKPENYDEWLASNIDLDSWGKKEREILDEGTGYEESDVISRRFETLADNQEICFVTLKSDYIIEIEDITNSFNTEKLLEEDLDRGQRAENACRQVKAYVTGYNLRRQLSSEQVTLLISTFANINLALENLRPPTAKLLIAAASVDGVVVTQELKDNCLAILTRNGF
jgi:hypothetical protein